MIVTTGPGGQIVILDDTDLEEILERAGRIVILRSKIGPAVEIKPGWFEAEVTATVKMPPTEELVRSTLELIGERLHTQEYQCIPMPTDTE